MTKNSYRVLLFSFFIVLFSFSIFLGYKYIDRNKVKDEVIEEKDNIDIYVNIPVISSNIKDINVICEINYTLCDEVVIESQNVISLPKEDIKKKYIDYNIIEEDESNIRLRKNVNTYCPNHFLLKILNDYVVIYRYITNDEIEIYKNTEIHKNELHDEILNDFEKGLKVNGIDKLNSIIEEIES